MKIQKNSTSLIVLTVLSFIFIIQPSALARSVYAVPEHRAKILNVYDVFEGAQSNVRTFGLDLSKSLKSFLISYIQKSYFPLTPTLST